jgi:hypothetical protein
MNLALKQYTLVIPAHAGIQYAAAYRFHHCRLWNTGSPAFAGDDSKKPSRGAMRPEFCKKTLPSRNQRAQGRPGARCTRGLACDLHQKVCTRAYRFSGEPPAFPAQWLYGLYEFILVTGFLATITVRSVCFSQA